MDGAVKVVPLTPEPDHTTSVTTVPAGNVADNAVGAPGHNVPMAAKVGAGTVATEIGNVVE